MADKNIVTKKEKKLAKELTSEEKLGFLDVFAKLPDNTFVMVPDDNIVYIGLSGKYIRQLHQVFNFLNTLMTEEDFTRFNIDMSNDFKDKDPESWTSPERFHMIMKELIFEIAFQAAGQKVDRVYDKNKIGESIEDIVLKRRKFYPEGKISAEGLQPLTPWDIQQYANKDHPDYKEPTADKSNED